MGSSRLRWVLEWVGLVVVVAVTVGVMVWRDRDGSPPRCMTPDVVRVGTDLVREHMAPGGGGVVGRLQAGLDGDVDGQTGLRHCEGVVALPHGEERVAFTVARLPGGGLEVRLLGVMPGCGTERVREHLQRVMGAAWEEVVPGSRLELRSVAHRAVVPETGERLCEARVRATQGDWVLDVSLSWADATRREFVASWEERRP